MTDLNTTLNVLENETETEYRARMAASAEHYDALAEQALTESKMGEAFKWQQRAKRCREYADEAWGTAITITNIRPGTTGVARSADMTALFPSGAKVDITLAAGEWQPGTAVTEWAPCGPSLDYWVSDPSAVPDGMADELAAAGQEALRAVDADLYDAILAVQGANEDD